MSEAPGVGSSLVRAPVTARPWVVALAEGVASEPVASSPLALSSPSTDSPGFGVALPEGVAEPEGVGSAGPLACTVRTGRK